MKPRGATAASSKFIEDGKTNFNKEQEMKDLISIAILIATLFGGTVLADRIIPAVRVAALTKAAQGLPPLTPLANALTAEPRQKKEKRR